MSLNIPFVSVVIARRRARLKAAEKRRLIKGHLESEWKAVGKRHKDALAEHTAACRRYHENPTSDNLRATWQYYDLAWKYYHEFFDIWKKLRKLDKATTNRVG